ncbi:hypothetical protein [Nocardia salmonicida]|uniref:hypothetical protein n=1 Tax=Nocardia salmonicida TaxID=53431 RepID=UPI0034086A5F
MEMHVGPDVTNYLMRLHTPESIRAEFGLPTDLSGLTVQELDHAHVAIQNLLTTPGLRMFDGVRNFLESENYRVMKQISVLNQQKMIQDLRGEVESQVKDPELRAELATKLEELAQTTVELGKQVRDIRGSDARASSELRKADAKWQRRKELMQLDRMAVIVGAFLLVGLATVLTVAMFSHTAIPEILSSAFLLILGFFFGQNSSRGGSPDSSN